MEAQTVFDLSQWERFKNQSPQYCGIMERIEELAISVARVPLEEVPENPCITVLGSMAEKLPKELQPPLGTRYALYLWAFLMATRIRAELQDT